MTFLVPVLSALALGALLWLLALRGARRNGIVLGVPPLVLVPLLAVAGLAAHAHAAALALVAGAIVAAAVDARTGYIFNEMSAAIALSVAACTIVDGAFFPSAAAALAFAGLLTIVVVAYAKLRGRAGLGRPDIILVGCIALGLGAWYGYIAVVAAFALGALYALAAMLVRGARGSDELRFGPFLAGGTLIGTLAQTFAFPGVIR